jgi:hypothetical protein
MLSVLECPCLVKSETAAWLNRRPARSADISVVEYPYEAPCLESRPLYEQISCRLKCVRVSFLSDFICVGML